MGSYKSLALTVAIIGALNWGLVGLFGINLVSTLFGAGSVLERVVYSLIGLGGLLVAWGTWGSKK
ncbi:DUF378 domain-containing protein [Candidatus Daviesbacteria bacterium RIFCSPLOWO2_01_FULL_43_38]|uniref:DUF378 domain-containing protein n=3 Tax=Candidatus Daviesiibacteriota TaxID=1752718 RepID=A0A1F5K4C6_9BACT|nr:MAG: hypothetical protein UV33_C0033G0008 [Candidatus Daviesbacteria bacterium GW2011_GWA1_42_6]KKS71056.1 MAG: hypothetical protein UV41_C0006G0008 [Candidatus Daviesbacteria bacterium GW2011_GWA2_42_7]OGE19989.1 MAG: DUF378 domain-containing protein [Candidatus Daviesbacteria bacterium RIFCSPHIGHO2_01_FULL_43_17]OGE35739.1 MAG: DUF378 domain-containing protein [Candidatus Daviesbacteria bacterium RIFCSPHIGHO2_12_FULL_43_11]OGE63427.1 MAG: DUF378 domain-containing protein [Candidatus Davies